MPKWTKYLEEDEDDSYVKIQKIPQKKKPIQDTDFNIPEPDPKIKK